MILMMMMNTKQYLMNIFQAYFQIYLYLGSQLIDACKNNNIEEVERCLTEGANPNYPDEKKWEPLTWASFYGFAQVFFYLINRYVNY